jgi:hypothetical protein
MFTLKHFHEARAMTRWTSILVALWIGTSCAGTVSALPFRARATAGASPLGGGRFQVWMRVDVSGGDDPITISARKPDGGTYVARLGASRFGGFTTTLHRPRGGSETHAVSIRDGRGLTIVRNYTWFFGAAADPIVGTWQWSWNPGNGRGWVTSGNAVINADGTVSGNESGSWTRSGATYIFKWSGSTDTLTLSGNTLSGTSNHTPKPFSVSATRIK